MKVGAVSGDLVVKLALGVAVIGAAWWVIRKGLAVAGDANAAIVNAAMAAVDSVNPLNANNVFAQGANAAASAIAGRPETAGGWIRSVTSDDDARIKAMLEGRTAPASSGEVQPDLADYRYF